MGSGILENNPLYGYHQLWRHLKGCYCLALQTRLCYGAQAGSHQSRAFCFVFAAALARKGVEQPRMQSDYLTVEWGWGAAEHTQCSRAERMMESDHDARVSGYSLQEG